MILTYFYSLFISLGCIYANKENNPNLCRCGESRKGEKVMPIDIQDINKDETSTTEAAKENPGDYHEDKVLTVKALDNNKIMVSSGSDKISLGKDSTNLASYSLMSDDEMDIRKKYAPYVPQMRPWLVIIEVNMTDPELNTECTGNITKKVSMASTDKQTLGAVLSPWWVISSRSCACGDK